MEIDEKKIAELKSKHPEGLFQITVEGKSCILRKPNRRDLSYVSVVKDPIKMTETLVNQLWVEGDEEMRTDDDLFMAMSNKMNEILKVKEAEVKKL